MVQFLRFGGLVAALAVVAHAAPTNTNGTGHYSDIPESQADWEAQEAAFKAMSFEQRLEYHSNHKIYRPEGTVKCITNETQDGLYTWLDEKVGECVAKNRVVEPMDDVSPNEGPCDKALELFELRVDNMCSYIQQDFSDTGYYPEETNE
ncbi:unnamed protein product [Aureobasidium uvarum]|uniref:Uncharacterized protein n=1 Tax=Aureobasidium uvarum TaxID=2773716 RepID=A0A9N8KIH0_9PEZI|nr:unnamed protein product [Aureobasidium uvarum]